MPPDYHRGACSQDQRITSEEECQCYVCKRKDSLYYLPVNTLNNQQVEALKSEPHLNYINIFGDKIIKNGVAALDRKFTRILEQGALATIFFADTDGYNSRLIESTVSSTLNIKQAVSWNTKIQNLHKITSEQESRDLLLPIFNEIVGVLSPEQQGSVFKEPEYYYNYPSYRINLPTGVRTIDLHSKFSFGDTIYGEFVGIYGEILLLKITNKYVAINTNGLRGYQVEIGDVNLSFTTKHQPKKLQVDVPPLVNLRLFG